MARTAPAAETPRKSAKGAKAPAKKARGTRRFSLKKYIREMARTAGANQAAPVSVSSEALAALHSATVALVRRLGDAASTPRVRGRAVARVLERDVVAAVQSVAGVDSPLAEVAVKAGLAASHRLAASRT